MQVYVYVTGKLEVRWSEAESAPVTGFKVQWRSGEEEWDASRSDDVDPASASAHVEWWPKPDSRRYRHALDGFSNGTEYEVRVIASNDGVDGNPSAVAVGTPQSDSTHAQAATFIENELISVYEDANPWLRIAFDWLDDANSQGDAYGRGGGINFEARSPVLGAGLSCVLQRRRGEAAPLALGRGVTVLPHNHHEHPLGLCGRGHPHHP